MIVNRVGKATPLKKIIYLCLSTILGMFLGIDCVLLFNMAYLRFANTSQVLPAWLGGLSMSIWMVSGFAVGRLWWRWLYVDRIWEKRRT